jgi:acetoin utilization deacetylase AcuC-like enzyme
MDPQASMMLCSEDFRYFTQIVKKAAEKHCDGKLLILHEGGYSEPMVPFCGLAVVEELLGKTSGIKDPFVADVKALGDSELQPHQKARIEQSKAVVDEMKKQLSK